MSLAAQIPFSRFSHRAAPERCVACKTLEPIGLVLMSDGRGYCDTCMRNVRELFNYQPVGRRADTSAPREPGMTAA
jgi:hypothetical protein